MSPSSLRRRPPAIPLSEAEVYLPLPLLLFINEEARLGDGPVPEADLPIRAAERRKGLDDWVGVGTWAMAVEGMGRADGA
jgi:hypothetical protein